MYPVAMAAMSGMALLMEGSTLTDGKYSKIGSWALLSETASVLSINSAAGICTPCCSWRVFYGEEEEERRHRQLAGILTRAVELPARRSRRVAVGTTLRLTIAAMPTKAR